MATTGPQPLRAGAARATITPPRGTTLIGYGDRLLGARGVHDDLTATALVLEDAARTQVAIVALDMLCLHEDVVAEIRRRTQARTRIPAAHVLLACSHTHAGPIAYAPRLGSPLRRLFIARLVARVVDAIAEAAASPEPATLDTGFGAAEVAVNRRERTADGAIALGVNPDGFVDRTLGVARLRRTRDGRALATLVSFACHPAVLSPKNRLVTAEWPGAMRSVVEAKTGAPCLFLQGATGNLNPRHAWGDPQADWAAVERIGRAVAEAALATLATGMDPTEAAPLAAVHEDHPLEVELRRDATGRVESYRTTGARKLGLPRLAIDGLLRHAYPWRPRLRAGATPDAAPVQPMEIQALRVGELALVSHAAETFAEIGAHLRAHSPFAKTFFVGYANGMVGYLPTASAHAEGGYEVEEAPLAYRVSGTYAPESEARVMDASLRLLRSLREVSPPGATRAAPAA